MNRESLEQWLRRLETVHPNKVDLGLERVSTVANTLQLLPVRQPVVTVAGTNGKGSTVAVLESLLQECGYSAGSFSSPHLLRFNERIRIAGVDAPDEEIVDAFCAIDEARGEVTLTYFEFAALAALLVFRARNPDIIILEVGLGGRLDAVNIVDPSVAVITSIDIDHQDWLGETRGEIAREKAGIMRTATPVVVADQAPPPELCECIADIGAGPSLLLGRDFSVTTTTGQWQGVLHSGPGERLTLAPRPVGALLPENICAALQAALLLGVDFGEEAVSRALKNAGLKGRRQRLELAGVDYVLDVSHNPAAVKRLLEFLDMTPCNGRRIGIFSTMSDKDGASIVDVAAGYFDAWLLADQPNNKRAAKATELAGILGEAGQSMISISKNLRQALRRAQKITAAGDQVVVFGSFYTVAEILPLLISAEKQRGSASE